MNLTEIIQQRIRQQGPVSFHDFMEMSLYYPGKGYYTTDGEKIGGRGDFYTSPCVTGVFGQILAKQLEEMWQLLGRRRFTIAECGAGTGLLCRDILLALKDKTEFYDQLEYLIVEKSETMREKEKLFLQRNEDLQFAIETGKLRWYDSIVEIPRVDGCFLSNELIDNLSVHRVKMEDRLMEVFVDCKEAVGKEEGLASKIGFSELLRPAGKDILGYFGRLGVRLPRGFRTEVNLEAISWIKDVSQKLGKGFLLTIDYGHVTADLYDARRSGGTLACYFRHEVSQLPYEHIGEQDITTHVNFTALQEWGEQFDLECCGYTNQAHFLQGLGLTSHLRTFEQAANKGDLSDRDKLRIVHTFLVEMGTRFKVLLQQKGVRAPFLSGLRFAQRHC